MLVWARPVAVVLGGLAVGLLNFGDRVGKISAALFTIVGMSSLALALASARPRARLCGPLCLAPAPAQGLVADLVGLDDTRSAMAIMIYALVTFHWRANSIRKRGSGPYDDR